MELDYNFIINVAVHIFILALFLTVFFFMYISKLTKEHIEDLLKSVISDGMNKYLDELNIKLNGRVPWTKLKEIADRTVQKYQEELPEIIENNKKIKRNITIALIVYFIVLVGVIVYLKYQGKDINLKFILLDNLIIFSAIAVIEFYFFTRIASQFIPLNPDDLKKMITLRIAENILTK